MPRVGTFELDFILAVLCDNQVQMKYCLQKSLNFDLVVELAYRHRVYPIIYRRLISMDNIPTIALAQLKNLDDKNKLQALKLVHETNRLARVLEENSLQFIIVKGVVLARALYDDITLRPCKDIDLLINGKDLLVVVEVLVSLGYELVNPAFKLTAWRVKYYINGYKEFVFIHKATGICVEPHWKIDDFGYLNNESIFRNKQNVNFFNHALPILSAEDNFIYLSLHAATHCFWRLRWLNDIALILHKPELVNWSKVQDVANQIHIVPIIHQAIILANKLFNAPIPNEFKATLNSNQKAQKLTNLALTFIMDNTYSFNGNLRHSLFYLYRYYFYCLAPRGRYGIGAVFKSIFKLGKTIEVINLPDKLAYTYYILHPLALIYRIFTKSNT